MLNKLRHAIKVNFANLVLAFHHVSGGELLTIEHINAIAPDIIGTANFAKAVYSDIKPLLSGDVVKIAPALADSIKAHLSLIPTSVM